MWMCTALPRLCSLTHTVSVDIIIEAVCCCLFVCATCSTVFGNCSTVFTEHSGLSLSVGTVQRASSRNGEWTGIYSALLEFTDYSKHITTLVTFSHSHKQSYTDGRGCHARCPPAHQCLLSKVSSHIYSTHIV